MLNRLYIVIGLLAILALGAAFVVPRFIAWGDYRDRMQAIGSEVLGAPVTILGDIEFALLPQPQLVFTDVVVGPAEAPAIAVARIEAQFSLVDFIRDRYLITRLVLNRPVLQLAVDANGALDAGIVLAEQVTTSNVSVANAQIVDGTMHIADARSGETFETSNIDGELRMDAPRGPFAFQGSGDYGGSSYALRFTTAAMEADGTVPLSAFARQAERGASLGLEGLLRTGAAPSYAGTLTYRQAPPPAAAETADVGRGDLVVTGKVEATPARILLSDYTVIPDENRGATRLLGAAEVRLGKEPAFNAVISGGVMALPPRDATAEQAVVPYELVRLLAELPLPAVPGWPGTVGVDIAELDLRAVSLRNLRLDATAGADGWSVTSFSAQLPGGAQLTLAGELTTAAGKPNFSGTMSLSAARLEALAQLWRKPAEDNPLFGLPGSLEGRVSLVGETLSLSNGVLKVDGHSHAIGAEIGFGGATRHLNLKGEFSAMSAADSAALLALLPDLSQDARFGVTFPKGRFDLGAEAATIGGLAGSGLRARGSWEGGVLVLDQLAAADLGGAGFDFKLTAFGSLAQPELSGAGTLRIAAADAPALAQLFDAAATPAPVRQLLQRSLPADLALRLDAPSGDGGQSLAVSGRAGAVELALDAQLGLGFLRALGGPLSVTLDATSADPGAMTAQLGLGEIGLVPEDGPMHLVAVIQGTASNSFETTLLIEGGADSLGFAGNVVVSDPEAISGNGAVKLALSDASALVASLGAGGIALPAFSGSANVDFAGAGHIRLEGIDAHSGGQRITGALALNRVGEISAATGALAIERLDPAGLLAVLAGPAALLESGDAPWPNGPLDLGATRRGTTGRIAVTSPEIVLGERATLLDARFELDWDAESIRLRDLTASAGGGAIRLELALCCAGPIAEKRASGRLTLTDVDIDGLAPAAIAAALDGRVDGTARFDGTGDSVFGLLQAMTGEGSYSVRGLRVERLDPRAFAVVGGLEDILELEPEALSAIIVDKLDDGAFVSPAVSGGFTIAGGVFRSPNVAIQGEGARLFGGLTLDLADLSLGGSYVMAPTGAVDPEALVNQANAQIAANLAGTLPAPQRSFDVSGMVDGIMVRAYEIEVARLEQLRAEDEARQRAAAEERARLAAEEAARKQAAEEAAAKQAAEEAAAKQAAEEAAAKRAAEEEARRKAAEEAANTPLDLGLPPAQ